jgi:hypothetical protein
MDVTNRIETMFKSLVVLRELPGHAERQETCISYRNSLLAALLPNIRNELTEIRINTLQEYLYVFRKLNREEDFEREFLLTRPKALYDMWSNLDQGESFSQWIAFYLGSVTKFVSEEEEVIGELFGDQQRSRMLHRALAEALRPMQEGLVKQLQQTNNVIITTECGSVLDEFCKRILPLLFTDNSRYSSSHLHSCLQSIFSSLWQYQIHYIDSEESHLRLFLQNAAESISFCSSPDSALYDLSSKQDIELDLIEPIELLNSYVDSMLPAIENFFLEVVRAMQRCAHFMGGVSLKAFSKALTSLIQLFHKYLIQKIESLSIAFGVRDNMVFSSVLDSYAGYQEESKTAAKIASQLLASDIDKQSMTTCALKCLQAVGCYKRCLNDAEMSLRNVSGDILDHLMQCDGLKWEDLSSWSKPPSAFYSVYILHNEESLCAEMKSFLSANTASSSSFAQGSFSILSAGPRKLATLAGSVLMQLCMAPLCKMLDGYRFDSDSIASDESSVVEDVEAMQENLLPQPVVTQVQHCLCATYAVLDLHANGVRSERTYCLGCSIWKSLLRRMLCLTYSCYVVRHIHSAVKLLDGSSLLRN